MTDNSTTILTCAIMLLVVLGIILFFIWIFSIAPQYIEKNVTVTEILGQHYEGWTGYVEYVTEYYYIRFNDGYYGQIKVSDCPFLKVGDNVTATFYDKRMNYNSLECPEERK